MLLQSRFPAAATRAKENIEETNNPFEGLLGRNRIMTSYCPEADFVYSKGLIDKEGKGRDEEVKEVCDSQATQLIMRSRDGEESLRFQSTGYGISSRDPMCSPRNLVGVFIFDHLISR